MDKTCTRQIIIIIILLIILYAVIHIDNLDDRINALFNKSDPKETEQATNTLSDTSESTSQNKKVSSNNTINTKHKNGYISEKINGITFNEQMSEIDTYVKIFQDSYDNDELLSAAQKVKAIDVHKYYEGYRDCVAQALEDKAAKIMAEEYQSDIIHWTNDKLIEFYDTMEKCFKSSGVEYTRSEDTHITYKYYYFMPN